ncbi:hypothetical protein Btru_051566, partial [Bulinus truncatus]
MDETDWTLDLAEEINNLLKPKNIFPDMKNWLDIRGLDCEEDLNDPRSSALMVACGEGNDSLAESLIRDGEDVDQTDAAGYTPLMVAVEHNREAVVQLLLHHGADVNVTNQQGRNALFMAAQLGHAEIMKMLLHQDEKVHISSAVLLASTQGLTGIADLILNSMTWWTQLIQSCRQGYSNIIEASTVDDVTEPVDSSYTPLMIAAIMGHAVTVETLIKEGGDVDKQTGGGWTALMFASCFRHRRTADLLLRHRASPNLYTMDGKTALQMAAYNGYVEIVDLLCQNGADVNLAPYYKFSPLILAASNGHRQIVETLLKYKCNIRYTAPITEKIELRQKCGQGKYDRRSSGASKKYLRALDVSVLFGHNECTQILQQEAKDVLQDNPEHCCTTDEQQGDDYKNEAVRHKHKELCNKNNRRHGVFISGTEMETFMKQL